jgi:ubiquitin carboxyl-terminal hydrolase 8
MNKIKENKKEPYLLEENVQAFRAALGKLNDDFLDDEQHDAYELLGLIVSEMDMEINFEDYQSETPEKFTPCDSEKHQMVTAWESYCEDRSNGMILDMFGVILLNQFACRNCGAVEYVFEDSYNLSLALPTKTENKTLAQCLQWFCREESVMGYNCSSCKKKGNVNKKSSIWRAPDILTLHFKKAKMDENDHVVDNKEAISFPLEESVMDEYLHAGSPQKGFIGKYKLYACVRHTGTMSFGHYTSVCLDETERHWINFDDSQTKEISKEKIEEIAKSSPDALILFYNKHE